ncbi:Alpha/beta hydrolase fold-1 [Niveomyces insectorum RCEF 264]|uniref:Alpha/beta hydrolase fold-1 n=1 Tax=Niveomyces insectorum RCEF 264 TaxID=1081102 RepID=A0A167PJQ5_9HYPO|nr:Alpha/beta hydrolase fold-1 [Niveomyces insectorum RCEF 264]
MQETARTGLVVVSPIDDVRIFYTVDGRIDGSKPILLFANSLAASTRLWDGSIDTFAQDYTIVRYDMRFHGESPLSSNLRLDYAVGHSMEDLTDDLLKFVDHLNIKELDAFVGLSIGAAVGLIFGAKHPDRVRRVVVVGTRATSNPDSNAQHAYCIGFGRANGPAALGRQSIARWFDAKFAATYPEQIAHAEAVYGNQSIKGYEASIAALRVMNLLPYAEDIGKRKYGQRFVHVGGELDGTVPQESNQLVEEMGSQVVVIPKSGHITNIQLPDEFHAVLQNILK